MAKVVEELEYVTVTVAFWYLIRFLVSWNVIACKQPIAKESKLALE